ncbi:hypothetical protein EXT58_19685 [Pectobacterium carotovorum subsp. carotovorum]|nr:hypothetical protein [Pectobacterium carotovorum subsp. carotovorum]MCL6344755.1 hypothetical protein [Pectobacterium carotovorum subsp. carotovorum]
MISSLCSVPTYSPYLALIELLWLSFHETIIRNHQCRYSCSYWNVVSPFLGNHHKLTKVERYMQSYFRKRSLV